MGTNTITNYEHVLTSMEKTFDQFNATLLYCDRCGRAMPVRQRLLLVLPDGELHEYLCQGCGNSVGSKTERVSQSISPTGRLIVTS